MLPCEEPCPKCGSSDVNRQYRAKGEYIKNEKYDRCENKFAGGRGFSYYAFREHIDNHCRCCHYRWQSRIMKKRSKSSTKTDDGVHMSSLNDHEQRFYQG